MHKPIGVFDSGMGGLTVLRALRQQLPYESFIYLGDTARLPYGTKSFETVKQYAMQMAKLLVSRDIKALVVACNTASAAALTYLQQTFTEIPVLGVVLPGARSAIRVCKNNKIAVLATATTIASGLYQAQIKKLLPKATVTTYICSLLVALAEEGMNNNDIAQLTLKYYLKTLADEDTIVLGCTHFPVFTTALQAIIPKHVQIVNSGHATAEDLKNILQSKNLLAQNRENIYINYLVTDLPQRFATVGEIFLKTKIAIS